MKSTQKMYWSFTRPLISDSISTEVTRDPNDEMSNSNFLLVLSANILTGIPEMKDAAEKAKISQLVRLGK